MPLRRISNFIGLQKIFLPWEVQMTQMDELRETSRNAETFVNPFSVTNFAVLLRVSETTS